MSRPIIGYQFHTVDPNFKEALERLEEITCDTVADVNKIVAEILTKKVHFLCPEYGCYTLPEYPVTEFRPRVHKLLQKLFKLKRTFVRKEKYALETQQHRESGFDQVCDEILYMPGLGEGYMAAQANFRYLVG